MSDDHSSDSESVPQCAVGLIVWGSRHYLKQYTSGAGASNWPAMLGHTELLLLNALTRVWDNILCMTQERVVLHQPHCGRLSIHEQALITGIRCLQSSSDAAFAPTMQVILPRAGVRLIRPAMQDVADALTNLEARQPVPMPNSPVRANHPPASTRLH